MSVSLPLLDHNPWSPSKAELAGRCGLAFKYRYVDKIPGGPRGTPAKVGVTVHRAQELVLEGVDAGTALDRAIVEVDETLTHTEEETVRTFAQSLLDFRRKVDKFVERYPVKELFLEKKWAITPNFEPCEFFDSQGMIRGVVDMGLLLENGYLVVIDHKSGRLRPMNYYGTQLDVYTVMAHAHYPEAVGVQCALNFMASSTVTWGTPKTTRNIVGVLRPWLTKHLNSKSSLVSGFPAKPGTHCKWCDYRSTCPEKVNNGNQKASE